MSLVRWNYKQTDPIKDFFGDEFLVGFPFTPVTGKQLAGLQAVWQPAVDVAEEIRVAIENGILSIEGERKSEAEQKDKDYHRVERLYGRFVRSFNLGSSVDDSKINANYKDGVLEITVPKVEKVKAKTIDVNVN